MQRILFVALLFLLVQTATPAQETKSPGKQELGGAERFVEQFEKHVERAKGAPFPLGNDENEALKRVKALKEKYPDDPKVKDLFERARKALLASKGEGMEITPDMLAYRENEKKMVKLFAEEADKQWAAFRDTNLAGEGKSMDPFPAPGVRDANMHELRGKFVVLEKFEYPTNQFSDTGREFVSVGSGATGYYYVDIGTREWISLYEAVKRYRRLVNAGLAEGTQWTMIGRISGLQLIVPDAGKDKVGPAMWGFIVVPEAILVPGLTFAVLAPESDLGGRFAGEERLQEIKDPLFTVKSIPEDVTPERLVEIFEIAIKEKNFDLYVECIDPARRTTKTAMSLLRYHWDLHVSRFATLYCHATVAPRTKIRVLKGFDETAGDQDFFLTEEEKKKIRERSEPLVEEAEVWTKAWTDKGLQYGSEKPHYLRRYGKKRWYISTYSSQF